MNNVLRNSSLDIFFSKIRSENKKIVFTNGCFDIIHPGHIHILSQAKLLGDIFSTKDYLYTALTIDGTTKLRRYSIEDSVPPPPRSGSDSDGNGYATSLNWTVTVDIGPLYEDSATEGNVFYLEGDNSNFNY